MEIYGDNFWPSILLGNIAFLFMIKVIRLFFKKDNYKQLAKFTTMIMLLFCVYVAFGTLMKMAVIPDVIAGKYCEISWEKKTLLAYVWGLLFIVDMPIYNFVSFRLRRYFKRKPQYTLHIYHNKLVKIVAAMFYVDALEMMMFFIARNGYYETPWNIWFALIIVLLYCGKIVLSILDSQKFEIKNNRYKYCNFKQRLEGDLSDIKLVELVKEGIVLHINEKKLSIECRDRYYVEEFAEKFSEYIKCENKIVYEEQTDKA